MKKISVLILSLTLIIFFNTNVLAKCKGNCKNGFGKFEWDNGTIYEGNWKKGSFNGKGKTTYPDGGFYEGGFKNHNMHGHGKMAYANGDIFQGQFSNGVINGFGKYIYTSGSIFEGEYINGLRQGKGTYTYSSGSKYIGDYEKGKSHGFGKYIWSTGEIYEGEYLKGQRTGKGKYTTPDGHVFVGEFFNGKKHGYGEGTYKNGDTVKGNYVKGLLNGSAEVYYGPEKFTYIGEYKDGRRHGKGKVIYEDGTQFVRNWTDDIPDFPIDKKESIENIETTEKYYALVIGNNNYQYLDKLDAAEKDAEVIAEILENKYSFNVELLLNANYEQTVDKLFEVSRKLKPNDNFLIYYAGHGDIDKKQNRGYWLPVDATYEKRSKWISNSFITDEIKATEAKHVLLIVDSCFSGSLMRSGDTKISSRELTKTYIEKLKRKKARLVITSGGNEPVIDSDGGDHSLFAAKLITTLRDNNTVINTEEIFENIRKYVVVNTDQTPERGIMHKTGHDGGDFLFFPKK